MYNSNRLLGIIDFYSFLWATPFHTGAVLQAGAQACTCAVLQPGAEMCTCAVCDAACAAALSRI